MEAFSVVAMIKSPTLDAVSPANSWWSWNVMGVIYGRGHNVLQTTGT